MEHIAKVDMLLSWKLTPKNLKSCRKMGGTGQSPWHDLQKSFRSIMQRYQEKEIMHRGRGR